MPHSILNLQMVYPKTTWKKYNQKKYIKNTTKTYTDQNYKRSTLVFGPIFNELNSKI